MAALRDARGARTSASSWPVPRRSATPKSCAWCCARCTAAAPLVHVPTPIVSRALRLLEATMGTGAFATWDEAELMEVSMISARGCADAERFGVTPEPMRAILAQA